MSATTHYTIGQVMISPYSIMLEVRPTGLTIEQFRADLPRLIAKLEEYIIAHHQGQQRA